MQQSSRTHCFIVAVACALGCLALLARPSISLPAPVHRPALAASAVKTGTALLDQVGRTLAKLRNEFPRLRSRPLALP